ncbi:MAG: tRNA (adenosine(37)-N6)-threonylcarbamoyltransferase complex transferase subunit TsaD [Desulfobulbaceae bacterium]|nr:tRNA (adenosine(37)-N6)-threonylcarbamoyltransferase complex transferase subunit TsaD [Candidatus Kapabacteria bacterium]MBS4000367.1 tRNA (adenosine(37)-N6)-threonylcarbamoyltransferase complex transferase subunit TsaD [Desulfobulbaceae bacterium]
MKILAIESSCDETSASVLDGTRVCTNIIASQYFHAKYGGVIPELASRAHLRSVFEIVNRAIEESDIKMEQIDAIAVTKEPGLIGSLIVGSNFAKGLALRLGKPIVPINHIEGHIYSGCLQDESLNFPFISLVVSGGNTSIFLVKSYMNYEVIGSTKDDAAGEAFDKIAKLIGLPYPGGPLIDKLAKEGNPNTFNFPRPMIHDDNLDFSFSGLKTSVRYFIHKQFSNGLPEETKPDFCASVQEAICDVLTVKTVKAALKHKVNNIVVAGGVSANSRLRTLMSERANKKGINVVVPKMSYCMDNAAMIGFLAYHKLLESQDSFFDFTYQVSASSLRAR